jgi:hypothetical protein
MDISQITDIKELKALAFDEIGRLEMAQNNLRILNGRIAELSQAEVAASEHGEA